jgi:hypothetical protein
VPADLANVRPATQTIAVGETFDFEYEAPPGRQSLWMDVRLKVRGALIFTYAEVLCLLRVWHPIEQPSEISELLRG